MIGGEGRRTVAALTALLVGLLALLAAAAQASAWGGADAAIRAGTQVIPDVDVPDKARDVLAEIERRHGEAPPGYVGGRAFQNRERRLPRGSYREYDVNPKVRGRDRGPERIVIERGTGKAYYTPDHYETFVLLN